MCKTCGKQAHYKNDIPFTISDQLYLVSKNYDYTFSFLTSYRIKI